MLRKLLSALALLTFVIFVLCSCGAQKIDITEYDIIFAEKDGSAVSQAAERIHALAPGAKLAGDITNTEVGKKEILIGNTNRTQSQIAASSLLNLDYTVKYNDGNVVICGGSEEATVNAVNYVIENYTSGNLTKLLDYTYRHEYSIKSLKVSGVDIKSFNVISTATDESYDLLKNDFARRFTELTGYQLREEAGALNVMLKCDSSPSPDTYLIKVATGDITICGANAYAIREATDVFLNTVLRTKTTLSDGDEFSGKIKEQTISYAPYINTREPLYNTYYKLTQEKKLNVVYFGGSVTSGYGASDTETSSLRALTSKWFEDTFPDAEINNYNSAISAGGSMLGAFRCAHDVIALDPDLVFIELSINDVYCSTDYDSTKLYYESIVRQIKENSPDCDIVALYVSDQTHVREGAGNLYDQALAAEEVAAHYKFSSINLGGVLSSSLDYTNDEKWAEYFIDIVHPTDRGYALYFEAVKEFLESDLIYGEAYGTETVISELPEKLSDIDFTPKMYLIDELEITENKNFAVSTESYWKTANPYSSYIYPSEANNSLTLKFTGNNVALFAEYGSDNRLIYSIDSNHERIQNQRGYHPLLLATEIDDNPGEHTLNLNVSIRNEEAPYIITALLVW